MHILRMEPFGYITCASYFYLVCCRALMGAIPRVLLVNVCGLGYQMEECETGGGFNCLLPRAGMYLKKCFFKGLS